MVDQMGASSHSLSRRMVALWVSVPAYLSVLFALLGKWVSRFLGRRRASEERNSSFAQKSITTTEPYLSPPPPSSMPGKSFVSYTSAINHKAVDEKDKESPSILQFRFQTYDEFVERNYKAEVLNVSSGSSSRKYRGFNAGPEESIAYHQVIRSEEEIGGVHDQSDLSSLSSSVDDQSDEQQFYDVSDDLKKAPPTQTEHGDDDGGGGGGGDLKAPITTEQGDDDDDDDDDDGVGLRDDPVTTKQDVNPADFRAPITTTEQDDNLRAPVTTTEQEDDQSAEIRSPRTEHEHASINLQQGEEEEEEEDDVNPEINSNGPVYLNHPEDEDFTVSSDSDSESAVSGARSSNFSIQSSLIDSSSSTTSDGLLHDTTVFFGIQSMDSGGELKSKQEPSKKTSDFDDDVGNGLETDDDHTILAELRRIEEEVAEEDFWGDKDDHGKDDDDKTDHHHPPPNEMEKEWEHQELIEQLKMEMKKVRATGLPTIFEESESLRVSEDLKPWKIEEEEEVKFVRVGGGGTTIMDEIHKFYQSYRERMRKLDIFNYQKMYAIGFLRLKDPNQPLDSTNITRDYCWPFQSKPSDPKYPMLKLRRDLESDLETVYVGQLCLSWEFLHWQYEKALSLWDADPRSTRTYNQVAGEFQQFQVLLQRFLEDEPFHGPRIQNFVRSRCINRHLLQVPLIKEDSAKQRRAGSGKGSITSLMLVEMVEESIRVLWRFIRTDKDAKTRGGILLGCRKAAAANVVELQDPADAHLLLEVEANLRKKYKKLRDAMRSECCILRKLQRHLGDQLLQVGVDEVSCFFSRVDLKLVSRVLSMSRITTEQLAWCAGKLNSIKIVNHRIHFEPTFLLFPC